MNNVLFVGFKGKNNASGMLAEQIAPDPLLLTNSFAGLRRDIDSVPNEYDYVVMFGVDKTLTDSVRIDKSASLNGLTKATAINLHGIKEKLADRGLSAEISEIPTAYLCNEAYWHMLEKFSGRAVFIHIPTIKNVDECFVGKMKMVFNDLRSCSA